VTKQNKIDSHSQ